MRWSLVRLLRGSLLLSLHVVVTRGIFHEVSRDGEELRGQDLRSLNGGTFLPRNQVSEESLRMEEGLQEKAEQGLRSAILSLQAERGGRTGETEAQGNAAGDDPPVGESKTGQSDKAKKESDKAKDNAKTDKAKDKAETDNAKDKAKKGKAKEKAEKDKAEDKAKTGKAKDKATHKERDTEKLEELKKVETQAEVLQSQNDIKEGDGAKLESKETDAKGTDAKETDAKESQKEDHGDADDKDAKAHGKKAEADEQHTFGVPDARLPVEVFQQDGGFVFRAVKKDGSTEILSVKVLMVDPGGAFEFGPPRVFDGAFLSGKKRYDGSTMFAEAERNFKEARDETIKVVRQGVEKVSKAAGEAVYAPEGPATAGEDSLLQKEAISHSKGERGNDDKEEKTAGDIDEKVQEAEGMHEAEDEIAANAEGGEKPDEDKSNQGLPEEAKDIEWQDASATWRRLGVSKYAWIPPCGEDSSCPEGCFAFRPNSPEEIGTKGAQEDDFLVTLNETTADSKEAEGETAKGVQWGVFFDHDFLHNKSHNRSAKKWTFRDTQIRAKGFEIVGANISDAKEVDKTKSHEYVCTLYDGEVKPSHKNVTKVEGVTTTFRTFPHDPKGVDIIVNPDMERIEYAWVYPGKTESPDKSLAPGIVGGPEITETPQVLNNGGASPLRALALDFEATLTATSLWQFLGGSKDKQYPGLIQNKLNNTDFENVPIPTLGDAEAETRTRDLQEKALELIEHNNGGQLMTDFIEKVWGGKKRIEEIVQYLEKVHAMGVTIFVVTNAYASVMKKALSLAGFPVYMSTDDVVFGRESEKMITNAKNWAILHPEDKQLFNKFEILEQIRDEHKWTKEQMLFIDDSSKHIQGVIDHDTCLCWHTKGGTHQADNTQNHGGLGFEDLQGALTCARDTSTKDCQDLLDKHGACDVLDGKTLSGKYPCKCGSVTCTTGQICTSSSNSCVALSSTDAAGVLDAQKNDATKASSDPSKEDKKKMAKSEVVNQGEKEKVSVKPRQTKSEPVEVKHIDKQKMQARKKTAPDDDQPFYAKNPFVAVSMTIEHVNFDKVNDATKKDLKQHIAKCLADKVGVEQAAVTVELSKGSVKVSAKISLATKSKEEVIAALKAGQQNDSFSAKVIQEAQLLQGIKDAAEGTMTIGSPEVDGVQIDASSPQLPPQQQKPAVKITKHFTSTVNGKKVADEHQAGDGSNTNGVSVNVGGGPYNGKVPGAPIVSVNTDGDITAPKNVKAHVSIDTNVHVSVDKLR